MKNPVLPSSCVTPAGTSIEVQNEWEENTTKTHIRACSQSKLATDTLNVIVPLCEKMQDREDRWMAMDLVIYVARQIGIKEYFSG